MIKLLIEKGGVDVNRKLSPRTGETVLLASCGRYGNLDIVKYLLENAKCDRGELRKSAYTCLYMCVCNLHVCGGGCM